MVKRLAAPDQRHSVPHAVGFSLAVSKLSQWFVPLSSSDDTNDPQSAAEANSTLGKSLMSNKDVAERSFGPWAVRRCDVYVVSLYTPGLVNVRLEICRDLWKGGINADLVRPLSTFWLVEG